MRKELEGHELMMEKGAWCVLVDEWFQYVGRFWIQIYKRWTLVDFILICFFIKRNQ